MSRKKQQVQPKEESLEKKFTAAHDMGAKEFGGLWLRANEVAIDGINMAKGNYADLKTKTMVSIVVLRVLVLARHTYTGKKNKADIAPLTEKEKRVAGFAFRSGECGDQLVVLEKRLEQINALGLFEKELPYQEIVQQLLKVK